MASVTVEQVLGMVKDLLLGIPSSAKTALADAFEEGGDEDFAQLLRGKKPEIKASGNSKALLRIQKRVWVATELRLHQTRIRENVEAAIGAMVIALYGDLNTLTSYRVEVDGVRGKLQLSSRWNRDRLSQTVELLFAEESLISFTVTQKEILFEDKPISPDEAVEIAASIVEKHLYLD